MSTATAGDDDDDIIRVTTDDDRYNVDNGSKLQKGISICIHFACFTWISLPWVDKIGMDELSASSNDAEKINRVTGKVTVA